MCICVHVCICAYISTLIYVFVYVCVCYINTLIYVLHMYKLLTTHERCMPNIVLWRHKRFKGCKPENAGDVTVQHLAYSARDWPITCLWHDNRCHSYDKCCCDAILSCLNHWAVPLKFYGIMSQVYLCACVYMCIHQYINICICLCMCVYINTLIYVLHMCISSVTCVYNIMCIHQYINICICLCMCVYINTLCICYWPLMY